MIANQPNIEALVKALEQRVTELERQLELTQLELTQLELVHLNLSQDELDELKKV
jgi:hypothetical protein